MTADDVRAENRRLDTELLAEARAADPAGLHLAPGEEWSLAQLLAHLGEFPRFFAEQLRRWRADPAPVIGRTHEHAARLAAVDDPAGQLDELVVAARSGRPLRRSNVARVVPTKLLAMPRRPLCSSGPVPPQRAGVSAGAAIRERGR